MSSNRVFETVSSRNPGRSAFDLSYEKKFSCDMGELIPVMCDEVVPGDIWKIGNEAVVRFQPLVAPILHEINMYVHYFFVPYRLLWNEKYMDVELCGTWESFITGGEDGDDASEPPLWGALDTSTVGTLWDYMGMPLVADLDGYDAIAFPKGAYNLVYNEFYRDENVVDELDIYDNETILKRAWEKDYFTSALPWILRGTPPALPISGTSSAVWPPVDTNYEFTMKGNQFGYPFDNNTKTLLEANTVDLGTALTFDITDLRLAFQVQRWMEQNARSGARYTEFLKGHFGVSPRDERLNRPEYIGGSKQPIIISEVLQTSKTDTSPQGNMAGHGLSVNSSYVGTYRAEEYGLIIGIMSVMPRSVYNSQGINRQWLRRTRYDFYFPEFANLSEQEIETGELYVTSGDEDASLEGFGYQGRYDELRTKNNLVCGDMRSTFDYWHLSRQFGSAPELNQSFIECVPRKDIFAAPSVDGLLISFGNLIKAFRPMPIQAQPGLIDH